jgi:hypothetical protein
MLVLMVSDSSSLRCDVWYVVDGKGGGTVEAWHSRVRGLAPTSSL